MRIVSHLHRDSRIYEILTKLDQLANVTRHETREAAAERIRPRNAFFWVAATFYFLIELRPIFRIRRALRQR
jgi:hypothetical protein